MKAFGGLFRRVARRLVGPIVSESVRVELERFFLDLALERRRQALAETAAFLDAGLHGVKGHPDRFSLLEAALAQAPDSGLLLEFGVASGSTLNFLASRTRRTVFGFDSFEGLPEPWGDYLPAGSFRQDGRPAVSQNVELVVGLFEESLPGFLSTHDDKVAFAHIDCDLYRSTRGVLDLLADRLQSGTILVFDEYFNYPGWRQGEHLAWSEFASEHRIRFSYIGYTHSQQLAVRVEQ